MDSVKYIGMDVHKESISICGEEFCRQDSDWNASSRPKRAPFCSFSTGCAEICSVTFEEGTWAAWLYDLLKPHVTSWWCVIRERMLC